MIQGGGLTKSKVTIDAKHLVISDFGSLRIKCGNDRQVDGREKLVRLDDIGYEFVSLDCLWVDTDVLELFERMRLTILVTRFSH